MIDDKSPSTLTCALVGLGGAAAVYGLACLVAGKSTGFGAVVQKRETSGIPYEEWTSEDKIRVGNLDTLYRLGDQLGAIRHLMGDGTRLEFKSLDDAWAYVNKA